MKPAKTTQQQEEMFAAWQDRQSVYYVAKTCSVSATTVRKYKAKNKWIERYEKIRRQAEKKADSTEAARQARWAKQGTLLQSVGTKKYIQSDGMVDDGIAKKQTPTEATRNIELGIKIEKEALGEPSKLEERKLIVEFVTPEVEKKKPKKKEKKDA